MCGRGRCKLKPGEVTRACMLDSDGAEVSVVDLDKFRPSFNVSPGAYLPVLTMREAAEGEERERERIPVVRCMKWGLVPSFTKKTEKPNHYRLFNAFSESVQSKASFRRLLPKKRCLAAMDGFYERKKDGSKKQPYYIYFNDGRPLVFAALYDCWHNAEGELLYTFTILTTSSSPALQCLHDRMPVILGSKNLIDMWLNGPISDLDSVTIPYEGHDLVWHPVTTAMGKPSFDGPDCIKEVHLKPIEKDSLTKFLTKPAPTCKSVKEEKEERETKIAKFALPKVKDEREPHVSVEPKIETEEHETKKRELTHPTSPLKKQPKISETSGKEQTLFS